MCAKIIDLAKNEKSYLAKSFLGSHALLLQNKMFEKTTQTSGSSATFAPR
jgi:hypothetical protein